MSTVSKNVGLLLFVILIPIVFGYTMVVLFPADEPPPRRQFAEILPIVRSSDVTIYRLQRRNGSGPGFIIAPIPADIHNHVNLHLPDPVCLAGCSKKER